jgi:hypothetical protein
MRNVKFFFSVAILTSLAAPSVYGQAEDHTGIAEGVVVGENREELVAPSLEWEVDEDTARDMCKLLYAKTYGKSTEIPWDEIQARVYPVYSFDGKRKYYLGLVYFGEGKMPEHEKMMESIKEGYKALKKQEELEKAGKEVPESVYKKIAYLYGFSAPKRPVYWCLTIPAITSYGTGLGLGEVLGMHDAFTYYAFALDRVTNKFSVSDGEVVGIICEGAGCYIEVKAGDEKYYASGSGFGGAYTESEVAEKSAKNSNKLISEDKILIRKEEWEQCLEEIERYNSGEPVIYPDEDEGGGSKGFGIKQEYRKENGLFFYYFSRR